eukprot:TRINITY_DN195_c0_g1_i1.p1 TRINITY_DN195_c0_g1~~TRINITY_DN195_c0_g1_i1.p1  ORF type:complete len:710 (+),score=220.78 TRINITY_DN195_c0_g1_i1:1493-3622(+)
MDETFNVLLTTYDYVTRKRDASLLKKVAWKYIVVDEGHRMKNHKCKLVQSLSTFRSRHRLLLTGTPLQNNIHELWALLHFVMPSIFDNLVNFDEWFNKPFQSICDTGDPLLDIDETSTIMTIQSLHRVLRPFLLRREKKQVEQLPEKVEKLIRCDMSGMQKRLYEQVREGVIFDDSRHIRALNAPMVQLRKVCNHPFLFYDEMWDASDDDSIIRSSGKFVMLDNIIAKMRKMNHKMLLFSQWVRSLDLIERFLNYRGITKEHYLRLDGSTKGEERAGLMKQFNAPDSPFFLFLMTTKAGGLGINLQAADTVLLFDLDWNPQNDAQAVARCHRIGQRRPVRVFTIISNAKFEERLRKAVIWKRRTDESVIGAGGFDTMRIRDDKSAKDAILQSLHMSVKMLSSKAALKGSQLNRVLARSEEEFRVFEEMDSSGEAPMVELLREDELPDWMMEDVEAQRKEEEMAKMVQMGRGHRVKDQRLYNFDLLSDRDFSRMLEEAESGEGVDIRQHLLEKKERSLLRIQSKTDMSLKMRQRRQKEGMNLIYEQVIGKKNEKGEQPARHFFQIPLHLPGFPKDAMSLHEIGEKIRSLEYRGKAELLADFTAMFDSFSSHFGAESEVGKDAIYLDNYVDTLCDKYLESDSEGEEDEEEDESDTTSSMATGTAADSFPLSGKKRRQSSSSILESGDSLDDLDTPRRGSTRRAKRSSDALG